MDLISVYPCLPRTERGKPLITGPDPKGESILYTNGNHVIIRNLRNLKNNDMYTQHSVQATVAKYSPSRFYVASGDIGGKVRIWDTTQKEHVLKAEYQPIGGPIGDLAWSDDSKRLVIGGTGREKFAAAILIDTGSTTGELMGMGRTVNSIDFKQNRPYRVITGSEDNLVCFFEGPPFKFSNSMSSHTNFVNSVRYSPNGSLFISAGADGKIFAYDGKTGEQLSEVGPNAHAGGIYAVEFSPKGDYFTSVSADKFIKFWTVGEDSRITLACQYEFEKNVQNILLSVTWSGDKIVATSLTGAMHIFDQADVVAGNPLPKMTIYGHSKPITCSSFNHERSCFVTASMDGSIAVWSEKEQPGNCWMMQVNESAHQNQVQAIVSCGDCVASVGIDDRLVIASLSAKTYITSMKLDSQPRSIGYSANKHLLVVATYKFLYVFCVKSAESALQDLANGPIAKIPVTGDPDAVAVNSRGTVLALGHEDGAISFYQILGDDASMTLCTESSVRVKQKVNALAFSPDDKYLASADADRTVTVFSVTEEAGKIQVASETQEWWRFHNARVNCLAWHPDSRRLASGSLDCSIIIWNLDSVRTRTAHANAHPMSQITSLAWESPDILLSTGQDASVKRWQIPKSV